MLNFLHRRELSGHRRGTAVSWFLGLPSARLVNCDKRLIAFAGKRLALIAAVYKMRTYRYSVKSQSDTQMLPALCMATSNCPSSSRAAFTSLSSVLLADVPKQASLPVDMPNQQGKQGCPHNPSYDDDS